MPRARCTSQIRPRRDVTWRRTARETIQALGDQFPAMRSIDHRARALVPEEVWDTVGTLMTIARKAEELAREIDRDSKKQRRKS